MKSAMKSFYEDVPSMDGEVHIMLKQIENNQSGVTNTGKDREGDEKGFSSKDCLKTIMRFLKRSNSSVPPRLEAYYAGVQVRITR